MDSSDNKRRKRNRRDINPPAMVLTERDGDILEAVYQCRVLRQDQIHTLFFGSSKTASQRRLALLFHHGYLSRQFLTVRASYLLSPTLYLIDKRGVAYLRAVRGYDELHWQPTDNAIGQQFLEHTLAINDVRIAVTLACQEPGYSLLTWQSESDLKAEFDRVPIRDTSGKRRSVSLIPDSYFVIETPFGKAPFFLELDRGTMTTKRFQDKVTAYLRYYESGAYEKRYGTKSLRVLTVTTSGKRQMSLQQATEDAKGGVRFWFTTLGGIQPATVFHAPIWSVATRETQAALIDRP